MYYIYTKEGIKTIPVLLLAFISGGGIQIYGVLLKLYFYNKKENIYFSFMQNIVIFIITALLLGLLLIDIMACSPFAIGGAIIQRIIINNEFFVK
ncbi:hypothetical protein [Helicobacter didelphidarum]|uniref:hypothetical protein n=1 Tax=Helicobacter didelphidarum TaxID=2040648 RepID=UPI0011C072AC|nr:hypothetical protein [Helicobacter didelphidarum]